MNAQPLRPLAALLLGIFLGVLSAPSAVFAEESFAPREIGTAGQMSDGVALFLPSDLPLEHLPPSLSLLEPPDPQGSLTESWRIEPEFSFSATRTRATVSIAEGTSLYGTGEVTGPLLRNGREIVLWNTDNYGYQTAGGQRLYQSHPWVLAVRADGSAFGVIADSTWRMEISLRDSIEFTSDGPSFPLIVIDRESPQAVLSTLALLTGKMPLPPLWALGFQQSRWSYTPAAKVREIADEFRHRQLPCDVIWMDIDYMDDFRVFTFDPDGFSDPAALNDYLHSQGFKAVWMIDPGVKVDPDYPVYRSGNAADVWVRDAFGQPYHGNVWPGECVFPDFTRPETREWWAGLYADFLATGIDGVWNDMNEPAIFDVPGKTMPLHNWHRGGGPLPPGSHARYHNVYGLLMIEASHAGILAANPDKRPFLLTRSNFLGGQRYAATWTGDNESTWKHLRWAIPMTLNLGLSAQPFNGPDLGGFGGEPTPELWAHWVAMGSLFPFARAHATKDSPQKEPWAFGPEVEGVARVALERRYRLLPFLYTLFEESSRTGLPVMRPVFFADPRDPRLRSEDQVFLLGGDLLVIPKWAEAPKLPKGVWRTVNLVGEDSATDPYQVDLRIRAGAIIPLGPVIQSTAESSLDPLTLLVCLDEKGEARGTLYEDDGDGFDYRQGDFLRTTFQAKREGNTVTVSIAKTEGKRSRPSRQVIVELIEPDQPLHIKGPSGVPLIIDIEP